MFIRPNWKNVKAYRENVNMELSGGRAWEFLRRNPEYQKEIALFEFEVITFFEENKKAFQDWLGNHKHPELFGSKTCFFEARAERFDYWIESTEKKWGLFYPFSTDDEWHGDGFIFPENAQIETFKNVGYEGVKGPRVLIPFDLSQPLEMLMKKAEFHIGRLRKQGIDNGTVKPVTSRILSNSVYVEQLRILDGIEAGETLQKIGEVISPSAVNDPIDKQRDKRIRAVHKAALKMQNGGYRVLI